MRLACLFWLVAMIAIVAIAIKHPWHVATGIILLVLWIAYEANRAPTIKNDDI